MKKVLLLSFALMLVASLAFATAGSIGIFSDPSGLNCNVLDAAPAGLKMYYVVHVNTSGATGSVFKATLPACMTGAGSMWLADGNQFSVVVGNTQTGYSAGYGGCKVGPVHVVTIQVFGMGLTPPCCYWSVTGDPSTASGNVEGADCSFNLFYPTGGQAIINSTPNCTCNVPTEDTTWGQVKSLFAE